MLMITHCTRKQRHKSYANEAWAGEGRHKLHSQVVQLCTSRMASQLISSSTWWWDDSLSHLLQSVTKPPSKRIHSSADNGQLFWSLVSSFLLIKSGCSFLFLLTGHTDSFFVCLSSTSSLFPPLTSPALCTRGHWLPVQTRYHHHAHQCIGQRHVKRYFTRHLSSDCRGSFERMNSVTFL